MIHEISDAICVVDHEYHVVWVNDTFKSWFPKHGGVLGKKLTAIFSGAGDACLKGSVICDTDSDNRKHYYAVECVPTYDENNVKVSELIAFKEVTILRTLLNISDLTVSSRTARELLEKALDIIVETLGYKTIAALINKDGVLELIASRGYSPMLKSLLAKQYVSAHEKGLAGRSAYLNQVIVKEIKEGMVSTRLLLESRRLGISTAITVPLSEAGQIIGVLAISTDNSPTPEELNLLKIVCNQISVSLRKILFEESLVSARDEIELYIDLMCHDITNANQVALGYLELINGSSASESEKYLGCAIDSIIRVNTLIDSVRKLRRSENDVKYVVNLHEYASIALEDARCYSSSIGKDVTFNYGIEKDSLVIANHLLKDLINNILVFLIHHIGNCGTIDIRSKESNDFYLVIFEDTGPGLVEIDKKALFKDILRSPRTGQSGIGMYLVKNFLHRFEGNIVVEDRIPDQPDNGIRLIVSLKKGHATPVK